MIAIGIAVLEASVQFLQITDKKSHGHMAAGPRISLLVCVLGPSSSSSSSSFDVGTDGGRPFAVGTWATGHEGNWSWEMFILVPGPSGTLAVSVPVPGD